MSLIRFLPRPPFIQYPKDIGKPHKATVTKLLVALLDPYLRPWVPMVRMFLLVHLVLTQITVFVESHEAQCPGLCIVDTLKF